MDLEAKKYHEKPSNFSRMYRGTTESSDSSKVKTGIWYEKKIRSDVNKPRTSTNLQNYSNKAEKRQNHKVKHKKDLMLKDDEESVNNFAVIDNKLHKRSSFPPSIDEVSTSLQETALTDSDAVNSRQKNVANCFRWRLLWAQKQEGRGGGVASDGS